MEHCRTLGSGPGSWVGVATSVLGILCLLLGFGIDAPAASAAGSSGVTTTTIKLGIPYVDIAAVDKQFGLKIDHGNYPDAYGALIANLNAHGGINGRKVVPVLVAVNPTGTAPAATACTQLTEDTPVFVSIAPLSPNCYLQHGTPTINATLSGTLPAGSAQNFTVDPPASAYDPLQLSVYKRMGVFKNKTLGVYGGAATDGDEVKIVDSWLAKNHIKVAVTATNSAPATDQTANYQQQAVIAQRFKSDGVNEVVAVGSGAASWPNSEANNEASYNPNWVSTSLDDLNGVLTGKSLPSKYLTNAVASDAIPSGSQQWGDPLMQKCVEIIKKAHPDDAIASPINETAASESDTTYLAPLAACQNLAVFTAIAKAAGKNLTVNSFTHAGYGLTNVTFPGVGTGVSFGPGRPYALGAVYIAKYVPARGVFVEANKPVSH